MRKSDRTRAVMWVAACSVVASASPARAEDASGQLDDTLPTIAVSGPGPAPDPVEARVDSRNDSNQIEEVLVTATKRKESVRDIPASITAVTGESLEKQGKTSLNDFLEETPGVVTAHASTGYTNITIRGVTTDTKPASNIPTTVGVFIGDSAFTDPYIGSIVPDLSAFDLSGVQILKGPQGTLFGGAALTGAIRYELNEPVLDEWQLRGFSQYVSIHQGGQAFSNGGAVNVPLVSDELAVRVGYVRRANPGVYDNERPGFEKKDIDKGGGDQFRAIVLWRPDENLKFKLTHLQQDYSADNAQTRADSPDGPRASSQFLLPDISQNKFSLDSVEANYDFESMRVVALSSYIEKSGLVSLDFTAGLTGTAPPPGYPQALALFLGTDNQSHSFSQELRLQSSGDDDFKWLVGGYFFDYGLNGTTILDTAGHQDVSNGGLLNLLPALLGNPINQETALLYDSKQAKSQEHALFTDLGYKLWDKLELSAGARFYETYVDGGIRGTGILVRSENNGADTDLRNKIKEHGISPKVAATYHFSDDVSLYASASRGFRFGGIQQTASTATNGVPPTYKSDSIWNYESGLRTNWLDNSLHADFTVFYIDYKNPIILQVTDDTVPLQYLDNVSAAISRGVEASLLWKLPIPGLAVSFVGGLTDAHITEPFNAADGTTVEPGQQLPGAAKSQYSGSLLYFVPLGPVIVDGNVSYTYVGPGYNDITHNYPINDYGSLNAGISLSSDAFSIKPRLSFNVTNITDTTAVVSGQVAQAIDRLPAYYFVLNTPRTYSARLSLDF